MNTRTNPQSEVFTDQPHQFSIKCRFRQRFNELFPNPELASGKTCYSDKELCFWKEYLEAKIIESKDQMAYLRQDMRSYFGTVADQLDRADLCSSREQKEAEINRHQLFIQSAEHALIRIQNRTYGISPETGRLIRPLRLFNTPHSTQDVGEKVYQRR